MSSHGNQTRLTRRQWTAAISVALPLSAHAQNPPVTEKTPPLGSPAPAAIAADADAKLKKAVDDVRKVSERLAQMEVPMNTEPAFLFRP